MRTRTITASIISMFVTAAVAIAGITVRVNVSSDGDQADDRTALRRPGISADGRYVVFTSRADNLVPGDTNGFRDIFRHDILTGATIRANVASSGKQADKWSLGATISADGRYVVFTSMADNLVPNDNNGVMDVFVHALETGETTRVSVSSKGQEAEADCQWPSISGDGRFVVFASKAANLVPNDTNDVGDIFLHDCITGQTGLVSLNSNGEAANGWSASAVISADGKCVAFISDADNLVPGDTNRVRDDFVRDLTTGTTTRVNIRSDGTESQTFGHSPTISGDGRYVAFDSYDDRLVPDDDNPGLDVFVHDRVTGQTTLISRTWDGRPYGGGGESPWISMNGRFVAFKSYSPWLVPDDTNQRPDIFVHDREIGVTRRASLADNGAEADGESMNPSIAADGRTVAFVSMADNLVTGDSNRNADIFVHDGACPEPSTAAYGEGWPGVRGVPSLFAADPPVICERLVLVMGNSRGESTVALLLIGADPLSIVTPWGGTLLVEPRIVLPLFLPVTGLVLSHTLACDEALCGARIFLQALELDPGASAGVSFSRGLILAIGT